MSFLLSANFFKIFSFQSIKRFGSRSGPTFSNGLNPDQDRHFVSPDLGPNCLQRLSANHKWTLARNLTVKN